MKNRVVGNLDKIQRLLYSWSGFNFTVICRQNGWIGVENVATSTISLVYFKSFIFTSACMKMKCGIQAAWACGKAPDCIDLTGAYTAALNPGSGCSIVLIVLYIC